MSKLPSDKNLKKLSYKQMVKLAIFPKYLASAIANCVCLLCGEVDAVSTDGICVTCGRKLTGEDEKISQFILDNAGVTVKVKLPDKSPLRRIKRTILGRAPKNPIHEILREVANEKMMDSIEQNNSK